MAHVGPVAGRSEDDIGKLQAWKGEKNGGLKGKRGKQMTRRWLFETVSSVDDARLDKWEEYRKPGDAISWAAGSKLLVDDGIAIIG